MPKIEAICCLSWILFMMPLLLCQVLEYRLSRRDLHNLSLKINTQKQMAKYGFARKVHEVVRLPPGEDLYEWLAVNNKFQMQNANVSKLNKNFQSSWK